MPGVVRTNKDKHVGHASPTPNPFHVGTYTNGSSNVFINGKACIRIGDALSCTDKAETGSSDIKVNGIGVHRRKDVTSGHGSWRPSAAAVGSDNVIANG